MSGIDDIEKSVNPHTGQPLPDEAAPTGAPVPGTPAGGTPTVPPASATLAPSGAPAPSSGPAGGTTMPSQQEMAVRSALETVMDPEIGLSVIDLGLIREINFLQPPKTHIRMMLTTPFCPYAPQMIEDVKQAAMSAVPQECEVELMPDAWSPELMPDPSLLGFSF